ncbi:MAG: hypothetical protein ACYSSM_04660 [Planctomycetota bacterium]|jgi:hypothetical protein
MSRLKRRADKDIRYMFEQIDSVDVDAIKLEGVTMRLGNKVVRLVVDKESHSDVEEQIKEEYREKLAVQLQTIKDNINNKVSEMSEFVNTLRREYELKERTLQKRLDNTTAMPDLNEEHMYNGLSICKGNYAGELYWLVQGIYWPKYVDRRAIEPNYTKKMMSHIIICIQTKKDKIVSVSTRKPLGFDFFQHYHQANPDCWGKWSAPRGFKNDPNEIIRIAQEVQVVLENINTGSIAKNNPRGLPRRDTLMRHLLPEGEGVAYMKNLRQNVRRLGAETSGININENDFWQTD